MEQQGWAMSIFCAGESLKHCHCTPTTFLQIKILHRKTHYQHIKLAALL